MKKQYLIYGIIAVAIIGVLFSGYLSFIELGGIDGKCRVLSEIAGLPTCVYGFFMYLILLILSVLLLLESRKKKGG